MTKVECPSCEQPFTYLGQHWRQVDCEYPRLTTRQREIVEGLLLSDGSITKESTNRSKFQLDMVNREFLEWVDDELGVLSTGVKEVTRSSDFTKSDVYRLESRRMPVFSELRDEWYSSGEKRYPEDLKLTPMKLTMWYLGDGHCHQKNENHRESFSIACRGEFDRQDYLDELFEPLGVEPSFYSESLYFGVDDSEQLAQYMQPSVPGFSHKWGDNQ